MWGPQLGSRPPHQEQPDVPQQGASTRCCPGPRRERNRKWSASDSAADFVGTRAVGGCGQGELARAVQAASVSDVSPDCPDPAPGPSSVAAVPRVPRSGGTASGARREASRCSAGGSSVRLCGGGAGGVGRRQGRGRGGGGGEKGKLEGQTVRLSQQNAVCKRKHFKGINSLLVVKPLMKSQSFINIYCTFVHVAVS